MPKPAPRQGPGRPKDLDKRAAVLTAAKTLFAQRGFDSVSMEAIATAAGVSKLTVYSHFTDKDTLFQAAVRSKCEEALPESVFDVSLRGDVRERLRAIARGFHQLVMSDESLGLHRLLIAQGASNTKLVELFYDSGPRRVISAFQTFLQASSACSRAKAICCNCWVAHSALRVAIHNSTSTRCWNCSCVRTCRAEPAIRRATLTSRFVLSDRVT